MGLAIVGDRRGLKGLVLLFFSWSIIVVATIGDYFLLLVAVGEEGRKQRRKSKHLWFENSPPQEKKKRKVEDGRCLKGTNISPFGALHSHLLKAKKKEIKIASFH